MTAPTNYSRTSNTDHSNTQYGFEDLSGVPSQETIETEAYYDSVNLDAIPDSDFLF